MEDMLLCIPNDKLEFYLKEIIFEEIPCCIKEIKEEILAKSKLIFFCQKK